MRRMEVLLQRCWRKCIFAGFEIGFLAIAVLFLHFGYIIESIGGTIAKIRAKKCVHRL